MNEKDIPLYVIAELLTRLEAYEVKIDSYKNHYFEQDRAVIYTRQGILEIPLTVLIAQFENPESISEDTLVSLSRNFKAY